MQSKSTKNRRNTYKTSMRVNYNSVPKIMREVLAVHEVLRRLGFESENIFTAYYASGIFIVLKDSPIGKTLFTITIDEEIVKTVTEEDFHSMYIKYCALWNGNEPGMSDITRQKIFEESIIISNHGIESLVVSMKSKGVDVPYLRQKISN